MTTEEILKQEAERKYPNRPGKHWVRVLSDAQREAYIAGALSRSGGVWVRAINQKPPDNKWPYEIVFRNITTKRVLDILSYWTEEKWELNDADQNGTPVGTLIPISEIEWLSESPAADKGDAIEFAEWIREKEYEPFGGGWLQPFYMGTGTQYTAQQLYQLFLQSKQTKK